MFYPSCNPSNIYCWWSRPDTAWGPDSQVPWDPTALLFYPSSHSELCRPQDSLRGSPPEQWGKNEVTLKYSPVTLPSARARWNTWGTCCRGVTCSEWRGPSPPCWTRTQWCWRRVWSEPGRIHTSETSPPGKREEVTHLTWVGASCS